ncbi:MAG: TIGR03809 family protein [Xanthobacteraceae bacterium]
MTHRPEAALDCRIVIRWCELAERRLEHLTDLRESGRWRRYYSEASFAADLRDAERAVAVWHRLVPREAAPTASGAATPSKAVRAGSGSGAIWQATLPRVAFQGADVVSIDRGVGLPVG